MSMKTILENNKSVGSSAYFGEHSDWFIAFSVHRDSDTLTRSNFDCAKKALFALPTVKDWDGEECPVQIERFSHWAVGWCDYLVVNPACKSAVECAEAMLSKLDDYPVLDESYWSELETDEANTVWRDCYRPKERIDYIRKHRSQFEFRDCADLLGCVRGKYFAGYASELLS